jgi:hypothetical protein
MLTPLTWTNLSLLWFPPTCCCCYTYEYVDYTYTVTLTTESGLGVNETVVSHTGNGTVEIELMMDGYQCEEFSVEISLPGNCQPAKISGALLLDPVYPKPQGLKAVLLNTTSLALTWTHPDTTQLMVAQDEQLTYLIRGDIITTGEQVFEYTTSIIPSTTPWEVVDLSGRECQEIKFSVSLVRDCRVLSTTAVLPAYPAEFSWEKILVEHFFSANLNLNKIEISFVSPALCQSQEANYTIIITQTASGEVWQVASCPLRERPGDLVRVDLTEVQWLSLEEKYSVTVTILTVLGNISSTTEFGICTSFGGVVRDLSVESFGRNDALLSWQHQWSCNFTSALPVTYTVTASLVGSGDSVYEDCLTVAGDATRSLPLRMEEHACRAINYSVALHGINRVLNSTVHTLPAYPVSFEQDVTAETTFESNGNFKHFEIEFKPPKLCDFQDSSYVLSYTGGNKSWVHHPVAIRDTGWVVKEEIESEMRPNTEYTITVTVITDSHNITSNTTVEYRTTSTSEFGKSVPGSSHKADLDVGVIAVSGSTGCIVLVIVVGGGILIACIRVSKTRREKGRLVRARANAMVHNPLYEGNDGHYEQLPDCRGRPPPSIPLPSAPPLPTPSYPDSIPHIPPPRENHGTSLPGLEKFTPKDRSSVALPESKSLSRMSHYSSEDCYTVMNSAGTLTILPRFTITVTPSSAPTADDDEKGTPSIKSSDDKCADDDDVSV